MPDRDARRVRQMAEELEVRLRARPSVIPPERLHNRLEQFLPLILQGRTAAPA